MVSGFVVPDNQRKRNRLVRSLKIFALTVLTWAVLAYLVAPAGWRLYEDLALPKVSPLRARTSAGIPGDALNVALIGSEQDLAAAMDAACWTRADPLSFASSVGIALSVVAGRPYPAAPVSTLNYLGRPEDVAFERPIGQDADRRHHIRLWQIPPGDPAGAPFCLGAATVDVSVGLNHLTGQFTHHIAPDIDAERDGLFSDLATAGVIGPIAMIEGSGAVTQGRNGEHDLFFTDGRIRVGKMTVTARTKENGTRAGCRS